MIPKKIHYCWFGGNSLPKDVKKCIKSWQKKCPDYEIIRWDENNFNINECEFIKEAYNHKKWAFVSDYARLKVIYENGGIYLDTDVELLKKLDELLNNKCYLPIQQDGKFIATGLGFGAEKHQKIIYEMMKVYDNIKFDIDKLDDLSCPVLNTNILKKNGYKYKDSIIYLKKIDTYIYPPKYFDPIAPGKTQNLLCDDTYSIHHYNASWTSKKNKLKRKIINFIGQNKINT